MSIPAILLEEHHEAFLVWEIARERGWLPADGSLLLHVDAHSDLSLPTVHTNLRELDLDMNSLRDFVYAELTVSNFILASIYRSVFERMIWVQHYHSDAQERLAHVFSYERQGRVLHLTSDIRRAGVFNPDRRHFSLQRLRCPLALEFNQPWALDIDLDYFSTNDQPQYARIEVTQSEYERFHNDRFHPYRMIMGAQARAEMRDGRCFLLTDYSDAAGHGFGRAEDAEIRRRITQLSDDLRGISEPPRVITICRSAFSAYTPLDQVEMIQSLLIGELTSLYSINLLTCDDF